MKIAHVILAAALFAFGARADVHRAGGAHQRDLSEHAPVLPTGAAAWFTPDGATMTIGGGGTLDEWRDTISGRALTVDGSFAVNAPSVVSINGQNVPQFDYTQQQALTSIANDWCPLPYELTGANPLTMLVIGNVIGGGGGNSEGNYGGVCSMFNRAGQALFAKNTKVLDHYDEESGTSYAETGYSEWNITYPNFGQPDEVPSISISGGAGPVDEPGSMDVTGWGGGSWNFVGTSYPCQGVDISIDGTDAGVWIEYYDNTGFYFSFYDNNSDATTVSWTSHYGGDSAWVQYIGDGRFYWAANNYGGGSLAWTARKNFYVTVGRNMMMGGAEGSYASWMPGLDGPLTPSMDGVGVYAMMYKYSHSRRLNGDPIVKVWDESVDAALGVPSWQVGSVWRNAESPITNFNARTGSSLYRYDWGGRHVTLGMRYDSLSVGFCSWMSGWIGEFAVYARELDSTERMKWTLYGMRKYGVIP